jgi:hypothetical protein
VISKDAAGWYRDSRLSLRHVGQPARWPGLSQSGLSLRSSTDTSRGSLKRSVSSRFQALALLKSGVPAVMVSSSTARLELQRGSQSEYGGILERLAWKSSRRSYRSAARMDDVLKVRLHRPSVADLVLIDRCEQPFERTLGQSGLTKLR